MHPAIEKNKKIKNYFVSGILSQRKLINCFKSRIPPKERPLAVIRPTPKNCFKLMFPDSVATFYRTEMSRNVGEFTAKRPFSQRRAEKKPLVLRSAAFHLDFSEVTGLEIRTNSNEIEDSLGYSHYLIPREQYRSILTPWPVSTARAIIGL